MDKKKFLIVVPNDLLGGAELYLFNMVKYMSSQLGMNGFVIFLKKKQSGTWELLDKERVTIYYSNSIREKYGVLSSTFKIISLSKKNNFKYILSSHTHVNGLLGFLRKFGFVSCQHLITRESTSIFHRFKGSKLLMFRFLYKGYDKIDLIICQTEFMKQQLISNINNAKNWPIKVIPNPIKLEETKIKGQEEIFIPAGDFIVSAGRLIPEKGYDLLIKVFKKINLPKVKLIILGEGIARAQLELLIDKLELQNKVLLPGFVANPIPYFKKAKLCVVSSRIEGFPNVLLQMMAVNNNVVSTQCAGDIKNIPNLDTCLPNDELSLFEVVKDGVLKKEIDYNQNKEVFDVFLKKRSVKVFFNEVEKNLIKL